MIILYDVQAQAVTEKKGPRSHPQQTEKNGSVRQKVELDRLKFKMNHTMQLLKEEQKLQEGKCCRSILF